MSNNVTDDRRISLQIDINQTKNQIDDAKKVLANNESFMDYIESFGLMVKVNGKQIPVDRTTICYYNSNQNLIKTRISMLKAKLHSYQNEINKL